MNNREQWLNTITNKYLRPHFASKGYTIPNNIRLSCSQSSKGIHTKKHQKRFTLGQCYPASMSSDNTTEIIIVPSLSDSVRVVDVLIHELCHATVGNKEGHNKVFADCAYAVGLEGKPTSTNATEGLKQAILQWVKYEGEYPHATLNATYKKQSTRLHKCDCVHCGYTMRISSKWLKLATPRCPLGHGEMLHDFASDDEDSEE
jgi:hypothetical protein